MTTLQPVQTAANLPTHIVIPLQTQAVESALHTRQLVNTNQLHEVTCQLIGGEIAGLASQIIDTIFSSMNLKLKNAGYESSYDSTQQVIDTVVSTINKYVPWALSFFKVHTLAVILNYYHTLLNKTQQPIDGALETAYTVSYPLSLANQQKVQQLQHSITLNQPLTMQAVEFLIDMIEEGVEYLLMKPKALLNFNFVVDKSLNGVITVTKKLGYHQLRKLAQQLPPQGLIILINGLLQYAQNNVQNGQHVTQLNQNTNPNFATCA